jgi:hypothetical protein
MLPVGALGCRETANLATSISFHGAATGYRTVRRVIASDIAQLDGAGFVS